jgi:hypothetical protein
MLAMLQEGETQEHGRVCPADPSVDT